MEKKIVFKLSPELGDGSSYTIVDNIEQAIEAIKAWAENARDYVGDEIKIEVAEMTKKEIDALPDV